MKLQNSEIRHLDIPYLKPTDMYGEPKLIKLRAAFKKMQPRRKIHFFLYRSQIYF